MRRTAFVALAMSSALLAAGCHKTATDNNDIATIDNAATPDPGTLTNDSSADAAMNSVGDDDPGNNAAMNPQVGGSNGGHGPT